MKNTRRGNVFIAVLVFIALASTAAALYLWPTRSGQPLVPPSTISTPSESAVPAEAPAADTTASWKTYRNENLVAPILNRDVPGLSFLYPPTGWFIREHLDFLAEMGTRQVVSVSYGETAPEDTKNFSPGEKARIMIYWTDANSLEGWVEHMRTIAGISKVGDFEIERFALDNHSAVKLILGEVPAEIRLRVGAQVGDDVLGILLLVNSQNTDFISEYPFYEAAFNQILATFKVLD